MRAPSLDPDALLAALLDGAFYSSTGPEILDVHRDGDHVRVRCSPARQVLLTGGVPGCRLVTGQDVTECVLPVGHLAEASHLRVTVVDEVGRRAWSNPLWPD